MANIPTIKNNPGDLKDPNTGQIVAFNDPTQGFNALKNDLQSKINGNTRTGLNGKSTLSQFASVYAPSSDNNDPVAYSQKLASKLGVTPDTPIGSLSGRLDDFASAVASNEGYQGNSSNSNSSMNPSDFAAKIKAKYPQYQNIDDNTLTQKILAKYPQYKNTVNTSGLTSTTDTNQTSNQGYNPNPYSSGAVNLGTPGIPNQQQPGVIQGVIQGVATPFLQAGSSIGALGNEFAGMGNQLFGNTTGANADYAKAQDIENNGEDYGYLGNQKPFGAGFDVTNPKAKPLLSAAYSGAQIGSDLGFASGAGNIFNGLKGLISGGSNFSSDIAQGVLQKAATDAGLKNISELSSEQIINALAEGAKTAGNFSEPLAQNVLQEATNEAIKAAKIAQGIGTPIELHPYTLGLLSKIPRVAGALGLGDLFVRAEGLLGSLGK